jgi:hypothetical protein
MNQLVGLRCLRCEKEIWSDAEGCFCLTCGTPHHHRCAYPDRTPATASRCPACQCTLDNRFAVQFRDELRRRAEAPARQTAKQILVAVLLLQLIAIVNLALGVWLTLLAVKLDPAAGGCIGAVWLLLIILVEMASISL